MMLQGRRVLGLVFGDMAEVAHMPEAFFEYEAGFPDVDMGCGVIPLQFLHKINQVWSVTGHRVHCNLLRVRDRMQLAAGPFAIYFMDIFGNHDEMIAFRRKVVDAFREGGYDVEPYTSVKERASRPQTVIAGTMVIPAMDMALILHKIGITHVRRSCECEGCQGSGVSLTN